MKSKFSPTLYDAKVNYNLVYLFLSQIHCVENWLDSDCSWIWWQEEASTVFSCNFELTLRWKWERDCGKWQMRLGRAIKEVICHHRVAHALWAGAKGGWAVGGTFPQYLGKRRGLGMQLTWTWLTPLTCQSGQKCVLDICWPVWLSLAVYMSICLSYYNLKKNSISFIHFHRHVSLHMAETNLLYRRFIKHYTYKSPSSTLCSSAWYVLPVLEFLTNRRLHYI